jgi:hypothetical protein
MLFLFVGPIYTLDLALEEQQVAAVRLLQSSSNLALFTPSSYHASIVVFALLAMILISIPKNHYVQKFHIKCRQLMYLTS